MQRRYDVLSDPEKRKQYDTRRLDERPARRRAGGTTFDFGDFDLGDIFGGLFNRGGAAAQQPQRGQRGNDVEVEVRVSFEDALQRRADDGAGRSSSSPATRATARARRPGTAPITCPQCNGSRRRRDLAGAVRAAAAVPALPRAWARSSRRRARRASGAGRERRTKRYTVKIPAGVKDGTRIKLKGKGEAGYGGAPAGDLYVVTRVEPSKIYERRGDDLVVNVPVSYPDRRARRQRSRCRRPRAPCR